MSDFANKINNRRKDLDLSLAEAVKDEAVSPLTAVESTLLKVVRDLTDEQAQAVLAIASTMAKK